MAARLVALLHAAESMKTNSVSRTDITKHVNTFMFDSGNLATLIGTTGWNICTTFR